MQVLAKAKKVLILLGSRSYRKALWMGTAAAVEHSRMLRTIPCTTIVDVGANRGQFALVAHRHFPQAAIFSFEPLSKPASVFRRVLGNEKSIVLSQCAIGPKAAFVEMHVSERDDSSSLMPIGELQGEIFPGTTECGRESVKVERLDSILCAKEIGSRALLKIDVQGYEVEVLEGCGALLEVFSYVCIEASFMVLYTSQPLATEVVAYLDRRGFQLKGVYNVVYDRRGNSVQADLLFSNSRLVSQPESSAMAVD